MLFVILLASFVDALYTLESLDLVRGNSGLTDTESTVKDALVIYESKDTKCADSALILDGPKCVSEFFDTVFKRCLQEHIKLQFRTVDDSDSNVTFNTSDMKSNNIASSITTFSRDKIFRKYLFCKHFVKTVNHKQLRRVKRKQLGTVKLKQLRRVKRKQLGTVKLKQLRRVKRKQLGTVKRKQLRRVKRKQLGTVKRKHLRRVKRKQLDRDKRKQLGRIRRKQLGRVKRKQLGRVKRNVLDINSNPDGKQFKITSTQKASNVRLFKSGSEHNTIYIDHSELDKVIHKLDTTGIKTPLLESIKNYNISVGNESIFSEYKYQNAIVLSSLNQLLSNFTDLKTNKTIFHKSKADSVSNALNPVKTLTTQVLPPTKAYNLNYTTTIHPLSIVGVTTIRSRDNTTIYSRNTPTIHTDFTTIHSRNTSNVSSFYQVLEVFKSRYPVKVWMSYGFFTEDFLHTINEHWLRFPPPPKSSHYILAALYGIVMTIGVTGNLLVIFMFLRYWHFKLIYF